METKGSDYRAGMCARETAQYAEELSGSKGKEPMMDAALQQSAFVFRGADICEELHSEREEPECAHIKEEEDEEHPYIIVEVQPEPSQIKEEEEEELDYSQEEDDPEMFHIKEEDGLIMLPLTFVPFKGEVEGKGDRRGSRGAEPPSSSSSQDVTTEGDEDNGAGSQEDGLLAPLSDSDDITSHSHDDDDDDDDYEDDNDNDDDEDDYEDDDDDDDDYQHSKAEKENLRRPRPGFNPGSEL
ncbi:calsequestrin-1-like isoform X2 [Syngnathoides biaculeatus]|uniref:calsequestrin-1-like isoform X2 n=1 Tax=Syngnathoides biaculeatus TaxID=300417 RepID=UPI002ADDFE3C|nr:calsequestrin-1-like isoform X2 [Syngnathoides biaculeatus]